MLKQVIKNMKYLIIIFQFIILFFSCSDNSAKKAMSDTYCPLGQFSVSWEEMAHRTSCQYEKLTMPCSQDTFIGEKSILLRIGTDGKAQVFFEGKLIKLKPSKISLQGKTSFWKQSFYNDSLGVNLSLVNMILSKTRCMGNYLYESEMVVKVKDMSFNYKLLGACDSSFIDSLRFSQRLH